MPVSVFADDTLPGSTLLTTRNVYGVLSDNFTGAVQERGYDTDNIKYFMWSGGGAVPPLSDGKSDATAKEGKNYVRITCNSVPSGGWAGFGYSFIDAGKTARTDNISRFRYLDFWIRKVEGNISQLQIGVGANGDRVMSIDNKIDNDSTDWQHVVIDISGELGVNSSDLSSANYSFLAICSNVTTTTIFDVDNIVLRTGNLSADFNINLKKVEDMEGAPNNPTQITWTEFSGWQAAAQYVEIDADKYDGYNWTLKLYTNNGAKNRKGLWAQGTDREYNVPMCFRVYNGRLYNYIESPIGDASYLIGYSQSQEKMYDRGVNPNSDPGFYPWLWLREYSDLDLENSNPSIVEDEISSITVWDSRKGYHVAYPFDWTSGGNSGHSDGFEELSAKVDKTLRVYFGGGFGGAAGGITYTSNVVFSLDYE